MASPSVPFQAAVSQPRLRALVPRLRSLPSRSGYQSERHLWDRRPDATALSSPPSVSRDWTTVGPISHVHAYGFGASCRPPLRSPSQAGGRSSGSPMVDSLAHPAQEGVSDRGLSSQPLSLVSTPQATEFAGGPAVLTHRSSGRQRSGGAQTPCSRPRRRAGCRARQVHCQRDASAPSEVQSPICLPGAAEESQQDSASYLTCPRPTRQRAVQGPPLTQSLARSRTTIPIMRICAVY